MCSVHSACQSCSVIQRWINSFDASSPPTSLPYRAFNRLENETEPSLERYSLLFSQLEVVARWWRALHREVPQRHRRVSRVPEEFGTRKILFRQKTGVVRRQDDDHRRDGHGLLDAQRWATLNLRSLVSLTLDHGLNLTESWPLLHLIKIVQGRAWSGWTKWILLLVTADRATWSTYVEPI